MTITPATSLRDLAFIVCTALHCQGTTAVLSGGGAATVYAPEAYQSRDLDFILGFWSALGGESDAALRALGFTQHGGTYSNAATPFTLEFPAGPLMVGEERIFEWDTLTQGEYLLYILQPTDCVRDRLAWFLFNNDFSSLEQALAVATRHPIDLEAIENWARREGVSRQFAFFRSRYLAEKSGG